MTLGQLVYRGWYAPLGWCERSWREGGPWAQARTWWGRRAMRQAAATLSPRAVREPAPGEPALVLLVGARYWEQALFCVRSWLHTQVSGQTWPLLWVDDGTLSPLQEGYLKNAFPGAKLIGPVEIEHALDANFPRNRFPALRGHRERYKHLRKLIDVHAVRPGINLVMDADMLFLRPADAVRDWWIQPSRPLVMTDIQTAYGYAPEVLSRYVRRPLPARINVGLTGLTTASVPWTALEDWTRALLTQQGSSYYLEQALVAMLLAGQSFIQLSPADYCVRPDPAEIAQPRACLHHYVAESKRDYFRHAWRRYGPCSSSSP